MNKLNDCFVAKRMNYSGKCRYKFISTKHLQHPNHLVNEKPSLTTD